MSNRSRIDDDHYRVTDDDGGSSRVYEIDTRPFCSDRCVQVAVHHRDGTTDAYEADHSFFGTLFHGGRGSHK